MRKILLLGLFVVLIVACGKDTNVEITGSIKDAGKTKVYLEQIDVSSRKVIDSTKINKNGEFSFGINVDLPTFYTLKFANNEQVTIIASPDEKIEVSGTYNDIKNNYWVRKFIMDQVIKFPTRPHAHVNRFSKKVLPGSPARTRLRQATGRICQGMGRSHQQTDQLHPGLYHQTRHLSGIILRPVSEDRREYRHHGRDRGFALLQSSCIFTHRPLPGIAIHESDHEPPEKNITSDPKPAPG